jgi:hypothetical protein
MPLVPGRYRWIAVYDDGSRLHQIQPDGTKNGYHEIDRSRLRAFEMWEGSVRLFWIGFKPGETLVWRRRIQQTNNNQVLEVCHIIGKKGGYMIALFESNGRIEAGQTVNEFDEWFYPVQYLEEEV